MAFTDIFPGLYRTKVIFKDFPGPGIFKKKNPGLSRRRGNPVSVSQSVADVISDLNCEV